MRRRRRQDWVVSVGNRRIFLWEDAQVLPLLALRAFSITRLDLAFAAFVSLTQYQILFASYSDSKLRADTLTAQLRLVQSEFCEFSFFSFTWSFCLCSCSLTCSCSLVCARLQKLHLPSAAYELFTHDKPLLPHSLHKETFHSEDSLR